MAMGFIARAGGSLLGAMGGWSGIASKVFSQGVFNAGQMFYKKFFGGGLTGHRLDFSTPGHGPHSHSAPGAAAHQMRNINGALA